MNDQQLEKQVKKDVVKVRKDFITLVEDGISQYRRGFEKVTSDAVNTLASSVNTVKKEIGHGLSRYNAKAQEFADKAPGHLGEKAVMYPWVTISLTLVIGYLLGSLLRPVRRLLG